MAGVNEVREVGVGVGVGVGSKHDTHSLSADVEVCITSELAVVATYCVFRNFFGFYQEQLRCVGRD